MKISYWVSVCLDYSKCYSIRKKTKAEVIAELKGRGMELFNNEYWSESFIIARFSPPRKIVVNYINPFDLIFKCLGEGGIE